MTNIGNRELSMLPKEAINHQVVANLALVNEMGDSLKEAAKRMLLVLVDLNNLNLESEFGKCQPQIGEHNSFGAIEMKLNAEMDKFGSDLDKALDLFAKAQKLTRILCKQNAKPSVAYTKEILLDLKKASALFQFDCSTFPTEVLKDKRQFAYKSLPSNY